LDAIAKTAYYCCGVRAADAEKAAPVCGDHLACRFMNDEANAVFDRFKRFRGPNASNVARHRMIDDWLRERLRVTPDLQIVILGAGFDTRAFRLVGGRWIELDQPPVIAIKEVELPAAEAPNPLLRIPIDFAVDSLADKLAPWTGKNPVVIVMEGVSMYLEPAELRLTLDMLVRTFPQHTLICDLMTADFVRRYSAPLRRQIEELGGRLAELVDDPAAIVAGAGYRQIAQVSIVDRARELGALWIPRWLLYTLLRRLRDGYRAYVFEATASTAGPSTA
jgi:methyltransferase (TIGR00027 family)